MTRPGSSTRWRLPASQSCLTPTLPTLAPCSSCWTISMSEIFNVLQVYLGSLYINDFNRFGRTWQVNVQAAATYRKQVEDLRQLKIRSDSGKVVPLGTFASVEERTGPVLIMRYNMYPAAAVNVTPAPGVSSGQAIE